MKKRKVSASTVGFVGLIVLIVGLLMAGSLRRSSHIVLPEMDEDSAAAGSSSQQTGDSINRVEVTPQTVQAAIATLNRPEEYARSMTIETLWSGGSSSAQANVKVNGALTRTDYTGADGRIRHSITNGESTWIWYGTSAAVYSASAGDISADEEQHIPTYEDVLDLDTELITAADYRTFSDQDCIYVETTPDANGLVMHYWVSVSSGLLIGAEKLDGSTAIYRMAAQPVLETLPTTADFTLPDGTIIKAA
ncbi:MAG: hypothetical protein LKJ86_01670 [Oscillibacter sp.]|jgi:hypothetical protein|nr:hypothetical protein [Oscillibacter sp.]